MKEENKNQCRVCLQCDFVGAVDIFDNTESMTESLYIYEKLNSIADIHIKPADGLPSTICGECLEELNNATQFKKKCEISNIILLRAASEIRKYRDAEIKELEEEKEVNEQEEEEIKEQDEEEVKEEDQVLVKEELAEYSAGEEAPVSLEEELVEYSAGEDAPVSLEDDSHPSTANTLPLQCHDCGAYFKSKCKLKVHWFKVHHKEQLTCPTCYKTFGSYQTMNNHKLNGSRRCTTFSQVNVTGEGKARVLHCKECNFSTRIINTMGLHLVTHSGEKKHACKLCSKRYTQLSGLTQHMEIKHNKLKVRKICPVCGAQLEGSAKYQSHMRRHKVVKCDVCKKQLNVSSLKNHMIIHENTRSFTCEQCAKSFKTFSGLWSHIRRVHKKIKYKHECKTCGFTTTAPKTYKKHCDMHLTSEKTFVCSECGKFFDNNLQLNLHKERHTNRRHKCAYCSATFHSRPTLLNHQNKLHKYKKLNID